MVRDVGERERKKKNKQQNKQQNKKIMCASSDSDVRRG